MRGKRGTRSSSETAGAGARDAGPDREVTGKSSGSKADHVLGRPPKNARRDVARPVDLTGRRGDKRDHGPSRRRPQVSSAAERLLQDKQPTRRGRLRASVFTPIHTSGMGHLPSYFPHPFSNRAEPSKPGLRVHRLHWGSSGVIQTACQATCDEPREDNY